MFSKLVHNHSETERSVILSRSAAEAKNLVLCIEECLFAKNGILRRFAPQNDMTLSVLGYRPAHSHGNCDLLSLTCT